MHLASTVLKIAGGVDPGGQYMRLGKSDGEGHGRVQAKSIVWGQRSDGRFDQVGQLEKLI